jgi:hypothetical protein
MHDDSVIKFNTEDTLKGRSEERRVGKECDELC